MDTNTLLAVDDTPDNLYVLQNVIAHHLPDCNLLTAANAEEGLALAKANSFGVALIDVQMPGMSGIEMCRRMRSDEAMAHLPVILITGHLIDSRFKAEGFEAGADDFLAKPIDTFELVAKIKVMLRIRRIERKRAEEALAEQMRLKEMLLDSLPHPAMLIDRDRKILSSNRVAIEIGAMPGKNCWEAFGQCQFIPEGDKLYVEVHNAAPAGGTHCSFCRAEECLETNSHQNDPELKAFERIWDTHWVPLNDSMFLHYAIDVTEQKKREAERENLLQDRGKRVKELRCMFGVGESIRKRETLAEVFLDAVAFIPQGWQYSEITRARINFDGRQHVFEPFTDSPWMQSADMIVNGERRGTIELFYLEERPEEDEGPFLEEERNLLNGIASVLSEAIEHRQAEKEREKSEGILRQAQKMEAIGTLAGGIAHDFNNILAAQIGYTDLAKGLLAPDSKAHAYLGEVEKASCRARDLVTQILTFSRQGSGERKPLNLYTVIKDALSLLRKSIPSTITFQCDIAPDCGIVLANITQIHQVIMNLCTNAYHAMRERGGTLSIRLNETLIDTETEAVHKKITIGRYVRLCVSDTGHGMDEATIARIFEPFYTTKEVGDGTGLGLSTVLGIVGEHGGALIVNSKLGEGATFEVYLPVHTQGLDIGVEKQDSNKAPIMRGQGERILFVDDEAPIVTLQKAKLERLGYEITGRTSSIEAMEDFRANPNRFDMVITDLTMPQLTGLELAREMLRIRPDIPLLLCTGFSETVKRKDALAAGVRDYIMKPVIASDLANKIHRALEESKSNGTNGKIKHLTNSVIDDDKQVRAIL